MIFQIEPGARGCAAQLHVFFSDELESSRAATQNILNKSVHEKQKQAKRLISRGVTKGTENIK